MKSQKIIILLVIVGVIAGIGLFVIQSNKSLSKISTKTTIEECRNTWFGSSKMSTPIEKQKDCALLEIGQAEPIKLTATNIGKVTISQIEVFANNDPLESPELNKNYISSPLEVTFGDCMVNAESESNASVSGCLLDAEESLQRIIRSLVKVAIERDQKYASTIDDTTPQLYIDSRKEYWQNWYYESVKKDSIKYFECEIEITNATFGGSSYYQTQPACYIRKNAQQILWMLKQLEVEPYEFDLES